MADNPAWRLYSLLDSLLKHVPAPGRATTEEVINEACAYRGPGAFGADHDEDNVLYHVFNLQQLIHEGLCLTSTRKLYLSGTFRVIDNFTRKVLLPECRFKA
jgi:hypothetical protein